MESLQTGGTAFAGQREEPVIVYRHGRWHFLTLEYRLNSIRTVNFMSARRARETIENWSNSMEVKPLEQVFPTFENELSCKVLPQAEDYRPLLRQGLVEVVGGLTTDTLSALSAPEDVLVAAIANLMKYGAAGPFLVFRQPGNASRAGR